VEYFKPDQLARELQSGRLDAITAWEPHASRALRDLGAEGIEWPTAGIYLQHFVLAAAKPTLAARRADLTKLLVALRRAQRFVADDPESAWRVLSTRLGMQPADARQYMALQDFRLRLDASLERAIADRARWIEARSRGPGAPREFAPQLIDSELMRLVVPEATTRR
jgi:NitT/TauT family transport system substrate-binding protein